MILFPNGYEKENKPILAGQTKALADNTVATSENASYPAINMVNPNENQRWESSTSSEQYITVTLSQDEYIDYIAFAGHNFGDDDFDLSVETFDGSTWVERLEPQPLTNNKPAILKIDPVLCSGVRLKIGASDTTPTISVLYAGLSVELERNIYVGHTPIPYGKTSNVVNGMSESGRFLGRIVIGENYNTEISISNITPSFFRNKVNPFFIDAEEKPFFFAWRPKDYNDEVGFAWFRQNGSMSNELSNGFVNISFPISAVVDGREITTEQPTERFITISSDVNDLNLRTLYDTLFPTPLDTTTLNVTVNSGVTIGATSTANAALDVGTWPSGTTINMDLSGTIQGAGGAGGDAPDGEGFDGGDAIVAARAITIDLASGGSIIDGAGGGGADLTNGGGGGAGSVAGVGGAADGGTAGNAGNSTTGGTASGNAGAGGNAGLIGADSDILDGGSSGCTIDDNPLITVVNSGSGTIEGCNVNGPDFGSIVIDVTTDQVDFNLRTAYDNAGNPTPTALTSVTCFVRNGVTISASDNITPAFDIGTWPVGVTILLNVNGTIVGAGGSGGNTTDGFGDHGGDALVTTTAISIDFADQGSGADGLIAGGGGGGQAGTTGGGGGGAGDIVGTGGTGTNAGSNGTATTGGAAGAGGGAGGDLGQDGEDNSQVQGASGAGSSGIAIDGLDHVTKLNAGSGTITGDEVNEYTYVNDDFADETGIDTGGSSNQDYDAANDWYTNTLGIGSDVMPTMTGSTTSGVTVSQTSYHANHSGYLGWRAFDNIEANTTIYKAWLSNGNVPQTLTVDLGSSTEIFGYSIQSATEHLTAGPNNFTFEGSDDNSSWTVLDTQTGHSWSALQKREFTLSSSANHRYYRIVTTSVNGASKVGIGEVELLGAGSPDNITLLSNAIDTTTATDDVFVELTMKPVDSVVINTDVTFEVSRDGGTTWTQADLVEGDTDGSGFVTYLDRRVDVSNQPTGTDLKYRVTTVNNDEVQISNVKVGYR